MLLLHPFHRFAPRDALGDKRQDAFSVDANAKRVGAIPTQKATDEIVGVKAPQFGKAFGKAQSLHRVVGDRTCGANAIHHLPQNAKALADLLACPTFHRHAQRVADSDADKATLKPLKSLLFHLPSPTFTAAIGE
jgi:hypothetical protein